MSQVTSLKTRWSVLDYLGGLRAYLGIARNSYSVEPGLYRIGNPDEESPVFISANYKLSLDHLRRSLKGIDSWILVIDTKGINVWCAAGKGSFGTETLLVQITASRLDEVVKHRKLILPQLSAPGIDGGAVKRESGFAVQFGPVEARNIPAYLSAGCKASKEMRIKRFSLSERFLVSLTHFAQGLLVALAVALLFTLLDKLFGQGALLGPKAGAGLKTGQGLIFLETFFGNTILSLSALFAGTILIGILLPILPGRAFTIKSIGPALLFSCIFWFIPEIGGTSEAGLRFGPGLYRGAKLLIFSMLICWQGLNLTGSSTYTSLSGVQREMSIAVPAIVALIVTGIGGIIIGGILI
jgi:hypothetical protein